MIPSKSPYSSGWSSTWTASRLSARLGEGPFGTAHDVRTPFISRRRSQWSRRAACMCTTKRPPGAGAGLRCAVERAFRAILAEGIGLGLPFYAHGSEILTHYERTSHRVGDPLVRAGFRAGQDVLDRRGLSG